MLLTAYILSIVGHVLVVFVTWKRTITGFKVAQISDETSPLSTMLLLDGKLILVQFHTVELILFRINLLCVRVFQDMVLSS